jgi:hypothetical protein
LETSAKKKTMVDVFRDCEGFLLCEFIPQKNLLTMTDASKLKKMWEELETKVINH